MCNELVKHRECKGWYTKEYVEQYEEHCLGILIKCNIEFGTINSL
jgi:hypothetical protein